MRIKIAHLFAFLLLGAAPLCSSAKDACSNALTTPEINDCARQDLNKAEQKLNDTYKKVVASLNQPDNESTKYSEVKKALIESQRAWVTFRQRDCDALFQLNAGGTIRTVVFLGCMTQHAEQRAKSLKNYLFEN
jgi:uncharacterized protein YecT (DUF1311 family)